MIPTIVFNLLIIAAVIASIYIIPVDPFVGHKGFYWEIIVPGLVSIASTVIIATLLSAV